MSTDALREALELKIDELLDEFVAELDRKTFEDYAQKRNTYSSRIAALAAHASETEKLPAKGESHDFNSDNQLRHWGDDRTLDLAKIIADLTPMVERFLKREIEAPAAHQYFREEAADKLRKWRELEAALKADRQGSH